jgi:glyoxylase-like metal-dependent hydrolase (beta-lactamase superfamily II)
MNQIKILIEGYARINSDGTWDASSTTTLIDTGKLKIIVDPGCNRKLLFDALEQENLRTIDINYVFLSHYHPDHCLLMGIFEKAIVFDSVQYQNGPIGGETGEFLPGTDIRIIKTPGHTIDHASLLVNTKDGKILVGADVFWWKDGETQIVEVDKHDDFASDQILLQDSRSKVLKLADFIIPGHGKMFKVDK